MTHFPDSNSLLERARLLYESGELEEAETICRESLQLQTHNPPALHLLGLIALRLHDLASASKLIGAAVRLGSTSPEYLLDHGAVLMRLGEADRAELAFRAAVTLAPQRADVHYRLAAHLTNRGQTAAALAAYRKVLELEPGHFDALFQIGTLLLGQGAYREAVGFLRGAVALRPTSPEVNNNLGNALCRLENYGEALKHYQSVIEAGGAGYATYHNCGTALMGLGQLEAAIRFFEKAIELKPDADESVAHKACSLQRLGRFEQAYDFLGGYLTNRKASPDLAVEYAAVATRFGNTGEAISRLRSVLDGSGPRPADRSRILFALSRAYLAQKEYDNAFFACAQANALVRQPFSREAHQRLIDAIIEVFDADSFGALPRSACGSDRPIFVLGMPRSGTTLIEQILASHSRVHGAGELNEINVLAHLLAQRGGQRYPDGIKEADEEVLDKLSDRYLGYLKSLSADAVKVVDKMPHNFLFIGLIRLLFPQAAIIHCTRDPLDVGLSIYFQNFGADHSYSNDLGDIGFYLKEYQRLMRHWQETLAIPMLELRYEELVEDVDRTARELIHYVGLPWEEGCLRFHETDRPISTASYQQVRRPLYRDSIGKWRHFEPHLQPLVDALRGA